MASAATRIFSGQKLEPFFNPGSARTQAVRIKPSQNYARGTVLGEITASPGVYADYASGHSDGTEVAKVILAFDVQTDASGNITLSPTASQAGGPFGETYLTVEAYYRGAFKTSELTGWNATAMESMAGHLISGTVADGVVEIG